MAPVVAYDLNSCQDSNSFSAIGNCIIRGSFGGSTQFFALIILLLFTAFMWQARIPAGAAIGIGIITFFGLSEFFGSMLSESLLNLSIIAIGVMVALAIIHFVRR